MATTLPIVNAATATFECIFGRGCEGHCCKNGRPSVSAEEDATIQDHLGKFLPHLRPEARELIDEQGYASKRMKLGQPMLRVVDGWCVFFNQGCVLHKVGAGDGDSYQYKPSQCALFPLEHDTEKDEWYVRQRGYKGEEWDLFCLNPKESKIPAVKSLQAEIALAEKLNAEAESK